MASVRSVNSPVGFDPSCAIVRSFYPPAAMPQNRAEAKAGGYESP
jgi:hypothetical protein